MVMAMLSWGLSWTNAKFLGQYTNPVTLMSWRFLLSAISIVPILYFSENRFKINRQDFLYILANSLFLVSYNFFYFRATQIGLAGKGGVLVTTLNPILTSIIINLFFNGLFSKRILLGQLLGITGGIVILRVWELDLILVTKSGNLYFLLASFSWVFVTIIASRTNNNMPFLSFSFWSFIVSFFLSSLFTTPNEIIAILGFDWFFWSNLLVLSAGAMSFGTSIYFLASKRIGPKRASSFILLVPFSAMIFARVFLGEPMTASTIIGGLIGVTSVYLLNQDV